MVVVVVLVLVLVYEILCHRQPSPSRHPRSMFEVCFRHVLDYVDKYVPNMGGSRLCPGQGGIPGRPHAGSNTGPCAGSNAGPYAGSNAGPLRRVKSWSLRGVKRWSLRKGQMPQNQYPRRTPAPAPSYPATTSTKRPPGGQRQYQEPPRSTPAPRDPPQDPSTTLCRASMTSLLFLSWNLQIPIEIANVCVSLCAANRMTDTTTPECCNIHNSPHQAPGRLVPSHMDFANHDVMHFSKRKVGGTDRRTLYTPPKIMLPRTSLTCCTSAVTALLLTTC